MAEILDNLGQAQPALQALQRLQTDAELLHDQASAARIWNAMGVGQMHLQQYVAALASFQQALVLRREVHERDGEANTLSDLGELYSQTGQLELTNQTFSAALQIYAEQKDIAGASVIRQLWALAYFKQKNYSKALENLYNAIEEYDGVRSIIGPDELRMSYTARMITATRQMAALVAALESDGVDTPPKALSEKGNDMASVAFYFPDRTRSRGLTDVMAFGEERASSSQHAWPLQPTTCLCTSTKCLWNT